MSKYRNDTRPVVPPLPQPATPAINQQIPDRIVTRLMRLNGNGLLDSSTIAAKLNEMDRKGYVFTGDIHLSGTERIFMFTLK